MSSSEIEEIKNRLNIVEVIGEYIRLTKAGSNWKALCPFHNEKTPSFMVSEERRSWHCFGCGKGGDVFSFLMELEGIGFREALERLAEKAGVELRRGEKWETEGEKGNEKKRLLRILELATKWYEKNLWEGKGKEKILGYLHERGIRDESIRKFRLGYAPEGWRNLLEFLIGKGYKIEEIIRTGLTVEKDAGSGIQNIQYAIRNTKYYDRFRDRIIFPIQDIVGRVVGFSARVAPGGDEKSAKYVNTPQTVLYDKGKILYGLNFAKVEIKKENETILVEGNMDVIASHQAGFENTVAVSGTALTSEQVKILSRYSENIKIGFDMDAAGQAAARRSIKTCLENDLNVKIILLSAGKDAADSLRKNPSEWKKAVESAEGVMEYYFREAFSRYNPRIPVEKKKIAKELLNLIKYIANPIEQSHWVSELATRIRTEERILFDVLKKTKIKEKNHTPLSFLEGNVFESGKKIIYQKRSLGEKILGILLAFPEECRRELRKIKAENFQNDKERAIIEAIKENEENFSLAKLKSIFSDYETGKLLEEIVFESEVRFGNLAEKGGNKYDNFNPTEELRGLVQRLEEEWRREKITRIINDIKLAETAGDKSGAKILMEEFQKLLENANDLKSVEKDK